jgi:hypothetical protein
VRDPRWLAIGWPLCAAIPLLFNLSIWLHDAKQSVWWLPAHCTMHLCIATGMALVVLAGE